MIIIFYFIVWLLIGFAAGLFATCSDIRERKCPLNEVKLNVDFKFLCETSLMGVFSWVIILFYWISKSEIIYKAIYKLANIGLEKDMLSKDKEDE